MKNIKNNILLFNFLFLKIKLVPFTTTKQIINIKNNDAKYHKCPQSTPVNISMKISTIDLF